MFYQYIKYIFSQKPIHIYQAVDQGVKHGGDKVIQDLNSCIKPGVRGGRQVQIRSLLGELRSHMLQSN